MVVADVSVVQVVVFVEVAVSVVQVVVDCGGGGVGATGGYGGFNVGGTAEWLLQCMRYS